MARQRVRRTPLPASDGFHSDHIGARSVTSFTQTRAIPMSVISPFRPDTGTNGHRRYRCSKAELDWFYDQVMSREVDLQLRPDLDSVPQQVMAKLNVVLQADLDRAATAIQVSSYCSVLGPGGATVCNSIALTHPGVLDVAPLRQRVGPIQLGVPRRL